MSSGYGPFDGTVTFPDFAWRESPRTAEQIAKDQASGAWEDGIPVEPCDLVLRVVGEGWGAHAGITVEGPDGETIDLPYVDGVVGIVEGDADAGVTESDGSPYRRYVVIPYEAIAKFREVAA